MAPALPRPHQRENLQHRPQYKTCWWWTHERLRRAYKRLERLSRFEHLFTYLEPEFANKNIDRTTNQLEGGINAPIRRLLNTHRGLSEPHMKKAIQWLLNQKSIDPANPVKYLTNQHKHLDQEKLAQPMPHPTARPNTTTPSTTTPNTKTDPYTSAKAGQTTNPPRHARQKTHILGISPKMLLNPAFPTSPRQPSRVRSPWLKTRANAHFLCLYFGVFAGGIA